MKSMMYIPCIVLISLLSSCLGLFQPSPETKPQYIAIAHYQDGRTENSMYIKPTKDYLIVNDISGVKADYEPIFKPLILKSTQINQQTVLFYLQEVSDIPNIMILCNDTNKEFVLSIISDTNNHLTIAPEYKTINDDSIQFFIKQ